MTAAKPDGTASRKASSLISYVTRSPQTPSAAPSARDKPPAFVAYELSLAKASQPMPATMKRALRIYMHGAIATRPCSYCTGLAKNPDDGQSNGRRKAYFGGLCVMPGKKQQEFGGCCACIGAGVPGCSAEYDGSLALQPPSAATPILFTASNHRSATSGSCLGKRQRQSTILSTLADAFPQPEPKRRMTEPAFNSIVTHNVQESASQDSCFGSTETASPSASNAIHPVGGNHIAFDTPPQSNDDAGVPDTVRATAVTKQIGAVNTNIAAERVRLRQRAAELQRMLDETTRELAAVNERTSALDKDEYVFSAIMDRTIINMAEYFASKHLPAVNAPTAAKNVRVSDAHILQSPPGSETEDASRNLDNNATAIRRASCVHDHRRASTQRSLSITPAADNPVTPTTRDNKRAKPADIAQRSITFNQDDLLTLATKKWVNDTVVKAYLDLIIAAAAAAATDLARMTVSAGPGPAAALTSDGGSDMSPTSRHVTTQGDNSPGIDATDGYAVAHISPSISGGSNNGAVSIGDGPLASVYAFDPLFWPRLCAGDVGAWRGAIRDASRHDAILVPALDTPAAVGGGGGGGRHWMLLMVLRAERAIECYDSLRNEERCWRALETVRTALVQRQLGRHWAAAENAEAAGASTTTTTTTTTTTASPSHQVGIADHVNGTTTDGSSSSSSGSLQGGVLRDANGNAHHDGDATGVGEDGGEGEGHDAQADSSGGGWELRIMNCAQQPNADDCGPYMLWFARCILLGAARATDAPPADFRVQIARELSALSAPSEGLGGDTVDAAVG